ncbi:MAG: AAA family ATPase, partial [Saprospiraceae bacterium]|nr:AAA family ATPase [Saprospiraceae bacterium]
MIERNTYIQQIVPFIDKPQVKIITGIRRSGKSFVLRLLLEELTNKGIKPKQVISVNFESFEYADLLNAKELYNYLKQQIKNKQRYYILLDEIQEVHEWEKVINSLLVDFNVDIYITGSNSHLLSSELATYLAGRYVEIPIYTLSYREFLDFRKSYFSQEQQHNTFEYYLRMGGFPVIHTTQYAEETAYKVVYD